VKAAHFVVPATIDDAARPSGGNVYDRKVIEGLACCGWDVHQHAVAGPWPHAEETSERQLAAAFARIPDDSLVVIDGLLACTEAVGAVVASARLRVVVLMHMPLGHQPPGHELPGALELERSVLAAASATIATSEWTRRLLLTTYADLDPQRVHVAPPGVDVAPEAAGSHDGRRLLCVAAVTRHKGLGLLLAALSSLRELAWQCTCVGVLDREPDFAAELRLRADSAGLADRITFTGPVVGPDLDRHYAAADLLVLPSRGETYGMVVTEALARGVPVLATAVGGVPDTIGRVAGGRLPGLLVPPDDAAALGDAIRRWLGDAALRTSLRRAARLRRTALTPWSVTVERVAGVISAAAA
jgi:glycosyltransferase involved in cell wall biosynthesis